MKATGGLVIASAALGLTAAIPAALAPADAAAGQARASAARNDFAFDGPMIQGGTVLGTAPALTSRLSFNGQDVPVAADGRFLIAFDRDAGPAAAIVATRVDGSAMRRTLTVQPRAWRIERLNTLPRYSQPTAEFQRRRPGELAQMSTARAIRSPSQGWRQRFMWPVTGRISGLFGSQRIYKGEPGAYHSGVDVARPSGTPVLAPADGVVILAAQAPFTLEGRLLMLDHGMGLNSAFLHLSRIDVKVGEVVRRGQTVGAVGATGRATGPHLHWGMKWNGARIDPLLLAGSMPVTAD
ncbi:M23 family metallopeptidase [Sphingomonas sp. BT-65]|uniref:M23 family metallopeptidase n=1 Tax=Sphingomonas sp. BT-65 TaxID=2989821 RepID=UPI0022355ABF|nr:M23 family metallopeptidase [Sphingomonas sp. BT-65]MCW4461714.1 M23 family metallopeptidase [Sphingomonas sp. BT-65]